MTDEKVVSLQKQNKILKEALEFYADPVNHEHYGSVTYTNELDLDLGFRARQALKQIKDLENESSRNG